MEATHIGLAHGNGGRRMRELIAGIFGRHLGNPLLDLGADAATLPVPGGELVVTTDGFTVAPLEFPGGDIGSLAVHGTVNDLAVAGADPRHLTLAAILEEGLEVALLDRVVASFAAAARAGGVAVVAGDTKVVRRGEGGGIYFAVTGIGVRADPRRLGPDAARPGDLVLASGPIGDHGTAVLLAREQFGLSGALRSDCASVLPLARALRDVPGLRFMRDPTRGGLATVAHEIVAAAGCSLVLEEAAIPVRDEVRSVCEILGYDPWYLACEGRIAAVVEAAHAQAALAAWRALPEGAAAAIVGRLRAGPEEVVLATPLGGERVLDVLEDEPLPRIC